MLDHRTAPYGAFLLRISLGVLFLAHASLKLFVFTPAGTSLALNRVGYGAMQLTGQMVWGPPRDREASLAVVREAVRLGINHIDTSDYYGPHIANEIIREALHPYPKELVIATKVGARRGPDKSWPAALSKKELINAVHDNLRHLGLDALDIVNLRVGDPFGPSEGSIAEPLNVLAELQAKGLIKHIGLSNVSRRQFAEGRAIAKIVCVQNHYNLGFRGDEAPTSRWGVGWGQSCTPLIRGAERSRTLMAGWGSSWLRGMR